LQAGSWRVAGWVRVVGFARRDGIILPQGEGHLVRIRVRVRVRARVRVKG
jgi:hypothetical protein